MATAPAHAGGIPFVDQRYAVIATEQTGPASFRSRIVGRFDAQDTALHIRGVLRREGVGYTHVEVLDLQDAVFLV